MLEIELDDRFISINESGLKTIQARWRGAVVRNQLMRIRRDYEQLFYEIERNKKQTVCFEKKLFSKPQINFPVKVLTIVTKKQEIKEPTKLSADDCTKDETVLGYSNDFERCSQTSQIRSVSDVFYDKPTRDNSSGDASQSNSDSVHKLESLVSKDNYAKESENVTLSAVDTAKMSTPDVWSNENSQCNNKDSSESGNVSPIEVQNRDAMSVDIVSTSLNVDNTSTWESSPNQCSSIPKYTEDKPAKLSRANLLEERKGVVMELLWVQQAICSRKQYLKLKNKMSDSTK